MNIASININSDKFPSFVPKVFLEKAIMKKVTVDSDIDKQDEELEQYQQENNAVLKDKKKNPF